MKCANCGKEVPLKANVCGYCGTSVKGKKAAAAIPVPLTKSEVKKPSAKKAPPHSPAKKAANQKQEPHSQSSGIPRRTLLVVAGIVLILAIASYFIFLSPVNDKELAYVAWHCDEEHVSTESEIVLFYYWTTLEKEQIGDYFPVAEHHVTINGLQTAIKTDGFGEIEQDEDGNFKQMYWMNLGSLDPGRYKINTIVDIKEPVFDGWDWFGPGTELPTFNRTCPVIVGDLAQ